MLGGGGGGGLRGYPKIVLIPQAKINKISDLSLT